MRIAIVDDEIEWINQIEDLLVELKRAYSDIEWDVFFNGSQILKQYYQEHRPYDVLIIDMEMPEMMGVETALKIRNYDSNVHIFFLTNYKKYVFDSFKAEALDYWIKPISFEVLRTGIERVRKKSEKSECYIKIIEDRKRIRIRLQDIIYIEKSERKAVLHTLKGIHKTNRDLTSIGDKLNSDFVRTCNTHIVNLRYAYIIYNNSIELYNADKVIPVSRTYKKGLMNAYMNYKEKESL